MLSGLIDQLDFHLFRIRSVLAHSLSLMFFKILFFRKNPQHFKEFSHPNDEKEEEDDEEDGASEEEVKGSKNKSKNKAEPKKKAPAAASKSKGDPCRILISFIYRCS